MDEALCGKNYFIHKETLYLILYESAALQKQFDQVMEYNHIPRRVYAGLA